MDNLKTVLSKTRKKKKVISLKKVILYFFLGLNLFALIGMYGTYVVQAPKHLREARMYFVPTLYFTVYEMFFLKVVRLDYDNPLLTPLHKIKIYFYDKGIEKLPEQEGERAIWYSQLIYYPINYSYSVEEDKSLASKYGEEFANQVINDIYNYFFILANYEISDFDNPNKRMLDRVAWGSSSLYLQYWRTYRLSEANLKILLKDKKRLKKIYDVYLFRKKFYNNPKYQNIINELNIDQNTKENNIYYISELFYNFKILEYVIRDKYNSRVLSCEKDKVLIEDYMKNLNSLQVEFKVTNIIEHKKVFFEELTNDGWVKPMLNKKCFNN